MILAALVAFATAANAQIQRPSAISGVALLGPLHVFTHPPQANYAPLDGAEIEIYAQNGALVGTVETDDEGEFTVPVPPGVYKLVPLPPDPELLFPRAAPRLVTVHAGQVAHVQILYKTGKL